MNQGFIKIYRKIIDWEWYQDKNTKILFLHCLLLANHTDKRWQGIDIKRGSFVTSVKKLSDDLRLTVRQTRVALDKLKVTNEVTIKTTPNFSYITINNYEDYQAYDKQNDNQMTNERQTNDKRMTTTNELKNDKNEKNVKKKDYIVELKPDYAEIVDYLNQATGSHYKHSTVKTRAVIQARYNEGFTLGDFKTVIDKKTAEWLGTDMAKYLRPETLFSNKFEGYLNQIIPKRKPDIRDLDIEPINLF